MPKPDLILLHAPSVYDFRQKTILCGPVSDQIPSTPVFEMYPIGLASIAEYLERTGYRVRIVNLAYRMLKDRSFNAEKMIERLEAPVFGVDLHWMVHCHGSIEIAKLIKKYHPQSKVLFGGLSSSYFFKELMEYPEIDYVMRGDSTEEPVRQLMECVKAKKDPEAVPNLVWRDGQDTVRENACSAVPIDLSQVMKNLYANTIRSVIRYRDLAGYTPFKGWTDYPITAVLTCRGCTQNCVICGASASTFRQCYFRNQPAFRPPEDVAAELKEIERFSNAPAFILGDLREAGEAYSNELFRLLQNNKVKNQLMFELFSPAPKEFLRQMSLCSPNFCLEISPESHDPAIRKASGRPYSSEDFEQMVADALDVGCGRLDVFYMIGLPKQTPQSVMENVDYCGYLMEKFKKDKRLYLFIAPLGTFLDPGSLGFEQPQRHGYRVLFRTLKEHRQALLQPSWKYVLNYETEWMTRQQIVDTSYEAMIRLNRLKAQNSIITKELAEAENRRLESGREMVRVIDDILAKGDGTEKLSSLKDKIDRINMSQDSHWAELKLPVGRSGLKFFRTFFSYITGRL